jgi:exodeoxyribonuclease V alpha subunit
MNEPQIVQRRIRVSSIRSANPLGQGGYIFYGAAIQIDGTAINNEHFVVSVPNRLHITTPVEVGQWWDVSGTPSTYVRERNGIKISERQIDATDIKLALPSGRHIITLLAHSERFSGIGISKATRLWETFGERLYELLKDGRADLFASVQGISDAAAKALVSGWKTYGDCTVIQRLHAYGISHSVAEHAISHFKDELEEALAEDPYRLLSFSGSWSGVDAFAMGHYQLAADDPRRLRGAAEEVLYRLFDEGHTAPPQHLILRRLQLLLDATNNAPSCYADKAANNLSAMALNQAHEHGILVTTQEGHQSQQMGAWVMESSIARAVAERLVNPASDLLTPLYIPMPEMPGMLSNEQRSATAGSQQGFELTVEQHYALQTIRNHRIALLSGGAGVGKTTLLRALYQHFDEAGISVIQASIAGRAAQRMKEATQRPARTLASLLFSKDLHVADGQTIVVIDEASMLDVITMYRLCQALPMEVRLLLVGDADQLMPVGPGLVFHELVDNPRIPHGRLTQIMRHGNEIAAFAQMIKQGVWPQIGRDELSPVAFLHPCPSQNSHPENQNNKHCPSPAKPTSPQTSSLPPVASLQTIAETIVRLYMKAPQSTQILCSLRNGVLGVRSLNLMCQAAASGAAAHLRMWDEVEDCYIDTGFRLKDPIVCTKNLWGIGILNGSLGRITEIEEQPCPLYDEHGNISDFAIAWVEWDDGERRPVTRELLPSFDLAYALTVHKAQGSQWPIVIVPVTPSRLLDRSLLYTAITRAQRQVLLLGDKLAAQLAVQRSPKSKYRHTALRYHLSAELDA